MSRPTKVNGKHKFSRYYCKKNRHSKKNYRKHKEGFERKVQESESEGLSLLENSDSKDKELLLVAIGMNRVNDSWYLDYGSPYHSF